MQKPAYWILAFSLLFTSLGLAGGWFAASQTSSKSSGHGHGHDEPEKGKDGHEGHDHGDAKPKISPQALESLGVTVAEAKLTTFYKYQSVPAVVTDTPATLQPVFSPIGGRVLDIHAQFGSVAKGGVGVVTLIRDPVARPDLSHAEEILDSINHLHKILRDMEILNIEIKRIAEFTESGTQDGLPILPKKNLIDLKYELSRSEQDLQNARSELARHALSPEKIAQIESATPSEINALLWSDLAGQIHASLPDSLRGQPWVVATINELVISGFAEATLRDWLKNTPDAGKNILEIGSLLQQGHSMEDVKALYQLGAMGTRVEIKAPAGVEDWDVAAVHVKAGQKINAGDSLMTLANPRTLFLRVAPVGGETATILNFLKSGETLEASPLSEGMGPKLSKLKVFNVVSYEDTATGDRGTHAFLRVPNEPFQVSTDDSGTVYRTWQLRTGQKYMLRIPVEKLEQVYVLPGDAVTDDGPDKVAFLQDGDSFKPVKVTVLYQDREIAVLGKNSEIFPGDPVAEHGALGLGLALKAGAGAADPHAGHQH